MIAVSELGSFSAAATALYISQPALTRRVALLEAELDLKLFIRTPRGVFLTDAGRIVIEPARRAISETERIKRELDLIHAGSRGSLLITGAPNLNLAHIGGLIGRFQQVHPEVDIRVGHSRSTAAALEAVESGTRDLAIVDSQPTSDRFALTELWEDDYFAVMAHGAKTAARSHVIPTVTADMIRGRPLVHMPRSSHPIEQGQALFDMVGVEPDSRIETEHCELLVPIAIGGHGVAIVPRLQAMRAFEEGAFVASPPERMTATISLARRFDEASPSVMRFLRLVRTAKASARTFVPKLLESAESLAS
ncbi:LysR family transcriptional regulator [Naasia lichenicola]|uniref:LysR family transcriptional regulator n=1 Tax=Naasia lichenicola TaxID=2565933 RepID=A0A4S4FSH1_9MICO|nr:LysR family transcriptional regulator [Naasia lichenicola]